MKAYVLTNGVDFLLDSGDVGRIHEGSPKWFEHMDEAGREMVRRPIFAFTGFHPELLEMNPP